MMVRAQAALSAKGRLQPFEYDAGAIGPEQVDIRVTHCGICHTDSAAVDNDLGFSQYPLVPGHEAVGIVAAVGAEVDRLQVGQRVGVGPMCGSCMKCEWCEAGLQHLCPNVALTIFGGHHGAFATHVRVNNWQFAFALPDEIKSEHAGPLMCAGATVFTPILQYGVRPTDRVAVVGVGGLGHLAVQYLAKWGCDVTAVSSSRDKEDQARELGARHFVATRGTDELRRAARSFDFIFCTVAGDLPWDEYLAALRPQGKLCIIGIPNKPVTFGAFGLIGGEKSIVGGQTGSVGDTAEMLAFTARHGIKPIIETFPMAEADRALEHTRSGKARFRAVLVS
jgi:uncharacterized zinc-type alcohol dehydrogenase-like protein